MRKRTIQQKHLNRRAFILGGAQLGISGILAGRLFQLQATRADEYATLAEDNRINLQLIVPERGLIVDRFNTEIATNEPNYQLMMERSVLKHKDVLIPKLAKYLQDGDKLEEVLQRQLKRTPHDQNILLKDQLSWEEVSAIEFHAIDLPGISVETGMLRRYPLAANASHLLGYVGTASPEEAKGNRLLKMPGMKIGKNGLEKKEEKNLRGKAGIRYMEVNALGQYLKETKRKKSKKGNTLHCTISAELQEYASIRLGDESGAAVILDTHNGDILALASVPAFDPNSFSQGISQTYWDELMGNKKVPLMNKAITGQYPPGSTFKMLVGLKAMQEGLITPESRVYCPGHFFLGRHRFNCWKAGGHGSRNYREAIEQSCDVFFYTVAKKLGMDGIKEMAEELGLGQHYKLGITGEKSGLIPSKKWKRASYNQPWHPGDTINASIGQGYVLTTPLQLAIMTARLATGKKITPRLIMSDETPHFDELSLPKRILAEAQAGMIDVTSGTHGTARGSQIKQTGFEMAGKTGTSQVRRITIRGQDQSKIPWEQRHHGLFVGYAPYQVPRYAGAVVVEHGGGSAAAAPVMRDIMQKTQEIMAREGA